MFPRFIIVLLTLVFSASAIQAQQLGQWVEQPIAVPVRGLMGISMADTGRGYAVGDVDVLLGQTGILVKHSGDPTWHPVPASAFSPPLNIALSSWAQDVHAVPNTSVAFISWRDDYRSLVYKTIDGGTSWFSVSPLNPILYGTRFGVMFKDVREGMIVGEGPGRVHRTLDGGQTWTNYTIPVRAALTDVDFSGTFWNVCGGENAYFRYLPSTQRWINLSFPRSIEFFPTHLKMSFVDDNHVFASGYNSGTGNHVLFSETGGIDWFPVPAQPNFRSTPEGHKGVHFFDTLKGWVASDFDEFAYTDNGGYTWRHFKPTIFGNKTYRPVNKLFFINEAVGWAVGGVQRTDGYPSLSQGWIFRWNGTQKPDISGTPTVAHFDTLSCAEFKDIAVPIVNRGTGNLTIQASGVSFLGSGFTLRSTSFPFTVAPGQTREMHVRWQPGPGYYGPAPPSSAIRIESNDAEHTPWIIALTGLRLLSELQSVQARLLFPTNCLGDSALAGLAVVSHGNLPPRILEVTGTGRGLVLPESHFPGDTVAAVDTLWFSLGGSLDGAMSGELQILAGDTACPELLTIPFEGFIKSNTLKITPDMLDFKDVCVGEGAVDFLEVKNLGTQDGRIRAVLFQDGDPYFSIDADTSAFIAPGTSIRLPVRYDPLRPDSIPHAAAFRVVVGPCPDTVQVILEGRAVQPHFRTNPDSLLVIGPVPLNIDVDRSVGVTNTGYEHVTVSGVEIRPPVPGLQLLAPLDFPLRFDTGDSLAVLLRYRAPARDSIRTQLRLTWSDPCPDTLVMPVLLISDQLPFAAHADSLLFAEQVCEDPVIDSFVLRNEGQEPLLLNRTDITGRDPGHFRLLAPRLPMQLAPDSAVYFVLSYDAPANGESRAELRLGHNDSTARGESSVRLIGSRSVRTLAVEGDTVRPLALCVGTPDTRRFTFRNPHDAALQLTGITLENGAPFVTLRHDALPATVAPRGDITLHVTAMVPLDTVVAVVIRATMEPCGVEYLLRFDAGVFHPRLTVLPDPLDFGVRALADTSTLSVLLQNSDSIDVAIDSVFLRGVSGALFVADTPAWPSALAPDSLLRVGLRLRMVKDTGDYAGSLCVRLSDPCPDTLCFPLSTIISGAALLANRDTSVYAFAFCDSLLCDTVRVSNPLSNPQYVTAAVLNPTVFSVSPDTAVLLEAGEHTTFVVCARPPATQEARGRLLLQGEGATLAAVELLARRSSGGLLLPDTLDAGNLAYCEDSREFVLRIENTAMLDEEVFAMQLDPGPFTILTQPPYFVRTGEGVDVRLRFTPQGSVGGSTYVLTLVSRSGGCTRTSTVVLTGRRGASFIEAVPLPLLFANVVAGSSQTRTLQLRNRDMRDLRLADVIISPDPPFSAAVTTPMDLDTGATLDIPVTFLPDSVDSYFGTICLVFDRPCPDTVCVSLEGEAIDGDIVFAVPELRFDTLAQCETQLRSVNLRNTGSTPVTLQGSTLGGAGAGAFTIVNPVTADEAVPPGSSREFRLRFQPATASDGLVTAILFVSTDAPKQSVVELPLEGTRVTQQTPTPEPVRVALGGVLLGSAVSFDAECVNTGTAVLRITGMLLPAGYAADAGMPAQLIPRRMQSLPFVYTPAAEGGFVDTLRLVLQPCDDTLRVIVSGEVSRPYTQSDADFGETAVCRMTGARVELRNNSGEEMEILALAVEGAFASRYSFDSPPVLPLTLPAHGADSVWLTLTPQPGDRGDVSAVLRSDVRIEGQLYTFRSALHASVFDGGLDFDGVTDLGASPIGEESPVVTVTGYNRSGYFVSIGEVQPGSPRLRIVATEPALPATLLPGDSLRVQLTFTPDRQGLIADSLFTVVTSPCPVRLPVPLQFEGRGDLLSVELRAGDTRGAIDDTIAVPLFLSRDITGLGVIAFSGILRYDASMLYPVGVDTDGSLAAAMHTRWQSDTAGVLTFAADSGRLAGDTDLLLKLRFLVLIGMDSVSVLRPAAAAFSHPAITVGSYGDGRFTLTDYCFADGSRLLEQDSVANAQMGKIRPS
ncbi:MAG: choice-of-anchor D domain-containing protein, partial [Bacteroidota bacterium]|nr:choice-of-anchor D domain-containing protein [Bacteroidota bacterium]